MERKKKRRLLLTLAVATLGVLAVCTGVVANVWFGPQFNPQTTVYIYIDSNDTADSVYHKVKGTTRLSGLAWTGFLQMARYRRYAQHLHTGRYAIHPGESSYQVLSRLLRGYQEPTNLVVGSTRSLNRLARHVGRQLMIDSADIVRVLADSSRIAALGYDQYTLPALFIPNTYEVYWDITAEDFLQRMTREHERFWNQERRAKAQSLGMTPTDVATLASIVEEETNDRAEKPIVAGLYINRLRRGMPLQADPTIRFALNNFERQRVTQADLSIDSPYNTYLYTGLPPGPIRIATPEGLDAVLNYTHHHYLYMCAKEDFSGRHNFASNYAEHLRNARRYQQELNKRKIYQ